jgi:hypothetical protein
MADPSTMTPEPSLLAMKVRATTAQAARDQMNGFIVDPADISALVKIDSALGSILKSQQDVPTLIDEVERLQQERGELLAALKDLVEDLKARWDMRDPRTNPGIRHYVDRAEATIATVERHDLAALSDSEGPVTRAPGKPLER